MVNTTSLGVGAVVKVKSKPSSPMYSLFFLSLDEFYVTQF